MGYALHSFEFYQVPLIASFIHHPPSSKRLLTASQPQNQVESRLLLDIVVTQGSSVLQLLTSKDKSLLVRGDTLLILDLGLDVVDGV